VKERKAGRLILQCCVIVRALCSAAQRSAICMDYAIGSAFNAKGSKGRWERAGSCELRGTF
jgi:hypothetical protein